MRDCLGQAQRSGKLGRELVDVTAELGLFAKAAHPVFGLLNERDCLVLIALLQICGSGLEEFSETLGLLAVIRLKTLDGRVETIGAQKSLAKQRQERRVLLVGRKRL